MQVTTYTTPQAFEELAGEWNALLAQSESNTLFLTHQWQRVWWANLGEGDLRVLALRDEGALVGIAPLYFTTAEGVVSGQYVGCKEVSDYLDFIFLKGREQECAEAVMNWLAGDEAPAWRKLALCNTPEWSPNLARVAELARGRGWQAQIKPEDVCPVIRLPSTFEEYLGMLDGRERRETQRKMRRAAEDSAITFAANPASLDADMTDFLRLMTSSMFSKSDFMTPRMEQFFRAMAREMQAAGFLQLAFLEVEGNRAAAYLNFVYDNAVLVYNSGLDPQKYSYLSPGVALIVRLIEKAVAEKRKAFDFLQGNEEYKYRLGGKDVAVFTLMIER